MNESLPTSPLDDTATGGLHSPVEPPLPAGMVLSGRHRIVTFLARGGMGEVYEAVDQELGEPVALKTIRPAIAQDERILDRFFREIRLARRVTHPNVLRVFDFGRHVGEGRSVVFLTMELLRGETLAERLRRGRLTPAEALPLVEQMVAGLAAAHAAGVIHRDLKPANVFLVPGEAGVRVVVTDFGLARDAPGQGSGDDGSATGRIVGTAAYMAPEQVTGGPLSPATDIYALGLVLYEMVTGTRPFEGSNPLSVASRRLTEPPPPPRLRAPELGVAWGAAILRCLAVDPARRFARVEDLLPALQGRPGRTRRYLVPTLALLAVAGVATAWLARPTTPVPVALATGRRSVAVLGFDNLSGRPEVAWLQTALPEMLTTELSGSGLRTVPGETVARMTRDLGLRPGSLGRETLARVHGYLAADYIVSGGFTSLAAAGSPRLRLDVRLHDGASGETLAAEAAEGAEADLFSLVAQAGTRLRARLGVSGQAGRAGATLPADARAVRLYADGLQALRALDASRARPLLEQAAAAEPGNALVHSALSEAWTLLGREADARREAQQALEHSGGLPREQRLAVEARLHEASHEPARAAASWQALFGFYPDDLEYGLRLAAAQAAAGDGAKARETVVALRRLAGDDPRVDLAEASASESLSDFKGQLAAATLAAQRGEQRGARLLVARAQLEQATAFSLLGDPRASLAAAQRARDSFEAAGDRGGVAAALRNIGRAHWNLGSFEQAARLDRECRDLYRSLENESAAAWATNGLAVTLHYLGRPAEARGLLEEALATFLRLGDPRAAAVHINLTRVRRELGDLRGARVDHREALRLAREAGNANYEAHAFYGLGEVLLEEGDLAGSREAHQRALAFFEKSGRKGPIAESQERLAVLDLLEGQARSAEERASRSLQGFAQVGATFNAAAAHAARAEALLALGRVDDARAAALLARSSAGEHLVFRVRAERVLAEADLAAGRLPAAREGLASALQQARGAGLAHETLRLELALLRVRRAAGEDVSADLSGLARRARGMGQALVARLCEAR
jgi:tetratricopeptide (TPR) repeat protein/TolB-like protein